MIPERAGGLSMNWMLIPTLILGFAAFGVGCQWARRTSGRAILVSWLLVMLLAAPGVLYAAYYSRLLGEPIWLYQTRTMPGSELLASFAGFAAGWFQVRVIPGLRLSRAGKMLLVPVLLAFGLMLPYLKPVFRPLRLSSLRDEWSEGVCMQSSFATCGPASAATILRELGVQASERELAVEAFSCASGTENWYLARALRRRGLTTGFRLDKNLQAPLPAIAGVRLVNLDNSGHFIALLKHEGGGFVVADSMEGRFTNTLVQLRDKYAFTGFLMTVSRKKK